MGRWGLPLGDLGPHKRGEGKIQKSKWVENPRRTLPTESTKHDSHGLTEAGAANTVPKKDYTRYGVMAVSLVFL